MKKKTKRKKLKTTSQLKKIADTLFSQYIRLKNSDENGDCKCYTCDAVKPWKEMQNGHFVSRTHLSTRWLEDNCRVQCMPCNVWKRGNYDIYALRLTQEKGSEILEYLHFQRAALKQMKRVDYDELIADLKLKIKDEENKPYF